MTKITDDNPIEVMIGLFDENNQPMKFFIYEDEVRADANYAKEDLEFSRNILSHIVETINIRLKEILN